MGLPLRQIIRNSLQERINLSYDQIDLDWFTQKYLVGRFFESEDQAMEYLRNSLKKERGNQLSIRNFIVVDEKDGTLSPFRILRKATKKELKRHQAARFIEQHGLLPSERNYPMYAYANYKQMEELKALGVKYKYRPIKQLAFQMELSNFLKVKMGANTVKMYSHDTYVYQIMFYNLFDQSKTIKQINALKDQLTNVLDEFNNKIGSAFYVSDINGEESTDSIRKSIMRYLKNEPSDYNEEIKYSQCLFYAKRYYANEQEFLAVIPMESPEKPEMY